jgi:hypothetical protein
MAQAAEQSALAQTMKLLGVLVLHYHQPQAQQTLSLMWWLHQAASCWVRHNWRLRNDYA